jgi:hypothetical protein
LCHKRETALAGTVNGGSKPPPYNDSKQNSRTDWAVHHSDKLPKKVLISLIYRQKSWQSTKDSCGFFLISRKPFSFLGAPQF